MMGRKIDWLPVGVLGVLTLFAVSGCFAMFRVYYLEGMYRNYNLNAPFDERSVAVHIGIMFTALLIGFFGWAIYRHVSAGDENELPDWDGEYPYSSG
jgi:TRAP-type C4-dicarboxylate transport system permease small subunit